MIGYDYDQPFVEEGKFAKFVAVDRETSKRFGKFVKATELSNIEYKTRYGSTLQTESEILSFTRLCQAIRVAAGKEKRDLLASDISQLLFSVDVANVETPRSNES